MTVKIAPRAPRTFPLVNASTTSPSPAAASASLGTTTTTTNNTNTIPHDRIGIWKSYLRLRPMQRLAVSSSFLVVGFLGLWAMDDTSTSTSTMTAPILSTSIETSATIETSTRYRLPLSWESIRNFYHFCMDMAQQDYERDFSSPQSEAEAQQRKARHEAIRQRIASSSSNTTASTATNTPTTSTTFVPSSTFAVSASLPCSTGVDTRLRQSPDDGQPCSTGDTL